MSRSCPYRREISDACNWHQEQALNSNIYILSQTGPTAWILKEETEAKNHKVFLGDIHNCTCPVFKKEKDLCMHICFILLKKFKVQRTDERSWQLGLNEREINQIIRGDAAQDSQAKKAALKSKPVIDSANSNSKLNQREITEVDCCPICQDELLSKKLPVTYCRFGCGNNVHIQCMKIYADHQKSNGETQLKCPLCRENFCSFENLDTEYRNSGLFKIVKQDLHYGLICRSCNSTPISGKCYKCLLCAEFYLCQACFNTDYHKEHNFLYREKATSKYLKANRDLVGLIPQTIAQHLATRDLNEEDYDLLLQLDERNNAAEAKNFSTLTEKIIKSWPSERVRENSTLLQPGYQCRICLRAYQLNQIVRKLPGCKHKFHAECVDNWLIHSHPTCPIDGQVVWDANIAEMEKEEQKSKQKSNSAQKNLPASNNAQRLADFSPLGLIINNKTCLIENNKQSNLNLLGTVLSGNASKITQKKKNPTARLSANSEAEKNHNDAIKIEGKNLNTNVMEDLNEYTNALILAQDLVNFQPKNNSNNKTLSLQKKIKPIKSTQVSQAIQKEPNSIPSKSQLPQIPQIEVKGNKINENQFIAGLAASSYTSKNLNYLDSLESSVLFKKPDLRINNSFNVPTGFTSKPYQLSKTSDFNKLTYDDIEDDKEEEYYDDDNTFIQMNNIKNDMFQGQEKSSILNENEATNHDDFISVNSFQNESRINSILKPNEIAKKAISKQKLRTLHPPLLSKKIQLDKLNNLMIESLPSVTGVPIEHK